MAAPEAESFPEPPDLVSRGLDNWIRKDGSTVDPPNKNYVYERAVGPKGVGVRGRLLAHGRMEAQAKRIWFWGMGPESVVLDVIAASRKGLVVD